MKKTIAKIMAAAMVLSTVAAPNVLAATVSGCTISPDAVSKASQVATITFGDDVYVVNGSFVENDEADDTLYLDNMLDALSGSSTTNYEIDSENLGIVASIPVDATIVNDTAKNVTSDSVTSATAGSKGVNTANLNQAATDEVLDSLFPKTTTSKKVVVNGEYKDVTVAPGATNIFMENWVNGVRTRWINRTAANLAVRAELRRQITNGNIILVPRTVMRNNIIIGTRWFFIRTLSSTATDDYWNAIVKLKADNNRYTPIRVHVSAYDGSVAGLGGLFVQIVNGTVTRLWDVNGNIIDTRNITTLNRNNNKLVVDDVQSDDLALLKSDVAKGKNLMLDEAYQFNVTDAWNNNSLNGAGNQVFDFWTLAENNDIGTISIGKIVDIRSRLFKDCKEKLVHAKNVKFVRNGTFRKNKQLKKAILSDDTSMKKINEKAFYDCKKLNTVKVKVNTLKQVGKSAFGGKTDKKGLKFNLKCGNKTQYNKAVKLFKKSGVKKAKFRKI